MWKNNIAHLNITSWYGISIGAEHYYGNLYYNNKKIEISRQMTKKEADYLNKKDSIRGINILAYEKGDKTTRFSNKTEIIKIAVKIIKRKFTNVDLLLEGDGCCASVNNAFWGKDKKLVERIKELYKEADKLNFYSGKDNKRMEEIDNEFQKYVSKI